jgi:tRNA(fMet)-specific endonuclease VapC
MKLLLDTNRLSDALAENSEVLDCLEEAEAIYIPVVALGEIRAGFLGGRRVDKNEARLQWFLSQDGISTSAIDGSVAHRYALVFQALRSRGKPIPTNDLWIAAIALEQGLVLYTRDSHFASVPGLACI